MQNKTSPAKTMIHSMAIMPAFGVTAVGNALFKSRMLGSARATLDVANTRRMVGVLTNYDTAYQKCCNVDQHSEWGQDLQA